MIPLGKPEIGLEEKEALAKVIDGGWLTKGPQVNLFEDKCANYYQTLGAVAVNSCTSGLHLVLRALGIRDEDEVLVPSVTFIATIQAVQYVGAKPILVDIESPTLPHMDIEDARRKINANTRAIIVMHYGGHVMHMDPWKELAKTHGLYLIEDAAHAVGARIVGSKSDAAVLSFFPTKNMTTAEGGMVLSNHPSLINNIRLLRNHSVELATLGVPYDVKCLGYNYRMNELCGAMGVVQMNHLEEMVALRQGIEQYYKWTLEYLGPKGVIYPFQNSTCVSVPHLMSVVLDETLIRKGIMLALERRGIQTSIHYPHIPDFTAYKSFAGHNVPNARSFCRRELTLPLYPSMGGRGVGLVVSNLGMIIEGGENESQS